MTNITLNKEVKKLHVETTVKFAINHIPNIDEPTLEKFLDLVNVNGNFGTITCEQILEKIQLIKKYIPNACEWSLNAVSDLLEVQFPAKEAVIDKVVGVITPFPEPEIRQTAWH